MDGIELAECLSDRMRRRKRPLGILLPSSDTDYRGLRRRLGEGAVSSLRQPFSLTELRAKIREARKRAAAAPASGT